MNIVAREINEGHIATMEYKKKKLRKNLHNVIIKFCQLDLDITMHGIAA
jgi:hypothetical protein